MRQLIVTEFITLDGVVEAPGGEPTHPHSGWTIPYGTPELYEYKWQETKESEIALLGRVTYEGFAAAWPERDGEFADKLNSMPKYVATSRPDEVTWTNTHPVTGNVADAVAALKAGDGGPILVHGSATLARSLLAAHLVDELHLMVFPVVVGGGLRLFGDDRAKIELTLTELVRYDSGAVLQVFRRP